MTEDAYIPKPLGPLLTPEGVHFSLFSQNATAVELCLFSSPDNPQPTRRIPLTRNPDFIWETTVEGTGPGTLYNFHVSGPYSPEQGHRFDSSQGLLDPYAPLLGGPLEKITPGNPSLSSAPNSKNVPLMGQVVDPAFDWGDDTPLNTPWNQTLIYETHVKGISAQHPDIPKKLRGTYLGLASPPIIEHLTDLGVTAVELLPVHQTIDEPRLTRLGLTNYWGYNTLLYFAPDRRFSSPGGNPVREFKEMVKTLHAAGIEVILDVVFNHTGEGNATDPNLSLRGLDNSIYYRLDPDDPSLYLDHTGCGNTLNTEHPRVRQLILDSLRHWVTEMHVDGFRFDLAVALFREQGRFEPNGNLMNALRTDPVLSQVKLIAEPWDLGPDGYQLSNFPQGWAEWNDQYRQTARRFWHGEEGQLGPLARRFSGSSDIFKPRKRSPWSSINYVTCHDGFTLEDLVSYNQKHNEANGEKNADGSDGNHSFNHGEEGLSANPSICELRQRQKRNLLATLLLSLGTPMLLGGDELGRTQKGNNNAYCQDNPTSWYSWDLDTAQKDFLEFTRRAIHLRKNNPTLHRTHFLSGDGRANLEGKDVHWLNLDGEEMGLEDWNRKELGCKQILLDVHHLPENDSGDPPALGQSVLILLNGEQEERNFRIPPPPNALHWERILDTSFSQGNSPGDPVYPEQQLRLEEHTLAILQASKIQ